MKKTASNQNLLEALKQDPQAITLSEKDVVKYNAVLSNPQEIKKQGGQVVFSIYEVDVKNDSFRAQNINAWGQYLDYSGKLSDVSAY